MKDEIIIKEQNLESSIIEKTYLLVFKGIEIRVFKWWKDDSVYDIYETDWEIIDEKTIQPKFTDEEWDNLIDYICKLI